MCFVCNFPCVLNLGVWCFVCNVLGTVDLGGCCCTAWDLLYTVDLDARYCTVWDLVCTVGLGVCCIVWDLACTVLLVYSFLLFGDYGCMLGVHHIELVFLEVWFFADIVPYFVHLLYCVCYTCFAY